MQLTVILLGAFSVTDAHNAPLRFRSDKVRALLAYLAVEQRPHTRAHLAGLLWPDQPDELALRNLSQTLVRLREALGDALATPPFLLINRQAVQWNPLAPAIVDAASFAQGMRHPGLAERERAAALYGGGLLPGFSLPDSSAFDEWLALTREQLERLALDALDALAHAYLGAGNLTQAEAAARRQLALDPWREAAHRQVMQALAASGQRAAALAQYATCRSALFDGLGVEPDPATTALYEQIKLGKETRDTRQGDGETAYSDASATGQQARIWPALPGSGPASALLPLADWGDAPDLTPLYGRRAEVALLKRWLEDERCRVVAIIGVGGQGKTTLAAHLGQAVAGDFEVLIWRSLLNAPPFGELLAGWLQVLMPERPVELHASVDERLALVMDELRKRRCLLVLDNAESILIEGGLVNPASAFRPGYEAYGQLLQRVGQGRHQSCLLLTSREEPLEVSRLAGERSLVHTLLLSGLEPEAGQELLGSRGLALPASNAAVLVERYSGNALALRLVAETIREFFAGDAAAFLAEGTPIFDDIRAVLDEQWRRLSPLERELLTWLAIEREPMPLAALQRSLVAAPARSALLDALRALQRRALLDISTGGFALQNVITEYVTGQLIAQVCGELESGQVDALRRYALVQASAKEYVRQSQARLLLAPVARWLVTGFGLASVDALCRRLLETLRADGARRPGYAAGNVLHLLVYLNIDLAGYDFSGLCVWRADLRDVVALDVNFANADFAAAAFTDIFDAVNSVAFSPDGQLLAAGSNNGVVGAWRVVDGQRHALFVGHTTSVWSVAFSPDGQLLASTSSDATVRLWDVSSGAGIAVLQGHSGSVVAAAFVPGTSLLATGGTDGTIRLWDRRDGVCQQVLGGHENGVRALAIQPSGALIAACDFEGLGRIWRIADGRCLRVLPHSHKVEAVAFSADGRLVVTGSQDKLARVWDIASGEVVRVLEGHHERICSAAWSPDGKTIATGGYDITIRLWDAASGEQLRVLRGHIGNVYGLAYSPDGSLLVSAGHDESVRVWSPHSGDELRALRGYPAGVLSIAFGNSSATLVSTQGHVARIWDVHARRLRRVLRGHRDVITSVSCSRDGARIASASHDRTVRLWDAASGQALQVLSGHGDAVRAVAFSPDGALVASASDDMSVRLWDARGGQLVRAFSGHAHVIAAVLFSPDGALLFSGSSDQTVQVWDVSSGQMLHALRDPHGGEVLTFAVSPDGATLALGTSQPGITLWDVRSGQQLRQLATASSIVSCLSFSPDGARLASGSSDLAVRLWDIRSWTAQVIGGHASWISAASWSPDGDLLVSSCTVGEIALWDGRTGARLGELRDAGPYAGMNIAGATGLTDAQRAALVALGAVDAGAAPSA